MSDDDFFRGLRDDIVDSTSKMMEEAPTSLSEVKEKKIAKEKAVEIDHGKQSESVTKATSGSDTVSKMAIEFVQLNIESKSEEKVEMGAVQLEKDKSEGERPGKLDVLEMLETKKSKKEVEQKEAHLKDKNRKKLKQKETKCKESKNTEAKLKEKRNRGKHEARPIGKHPDTEIYNEQQKHPDVHHAQLIELQSAIKQIEDHIDAIKGAHRDVKSATHRIETMKNSSSTSKKEAKGTIKESRPKVIRLESESTKKESKRKHKEYEVIPMRGAVSNRSIEHQNDDGVSAEHRLLLKLFTLSSSQRKKYIEKRGIELGLLDLHPFKRHVVLVNERFQNVSEDLFAEAKTYITGAKIIDETSTEKNPAPTSQTRAKQELKTFEDQVNYLLNDGKHCAVENYNPELTLTAAGNETQMIIQDRLESFVEQLVQKNVGYVVNGLLRINARNNLQSFVDDVSRGENVYINSILLRRCAMEGDLVKVFVMHRPVTAGSTTDVSEAEGECMDSTMGSATEDSGGQKPTVNQNSMGFVINILEKRHKRQCVGKFVSSASGKKHYRMFMPRDQRIPPVRVFKQDWPNALIEIKSQSAIEEGGGDRTKQPQYTDVTEVLYQAEIIDWQDDIPIGTILKSIGHCGVLEVETESILIEYNLDVTPYGEHILAQLPAAPYSIPPEEIGRRTDLRRECIFTIDPATARDLDDALSCKVLQNGNFEVGVHISDVTYFLREQSELDDLVNLRATSIYMVDAVYHMLPKQLCNICSLLPGEEKLAFSVFWEMGPDGTVMSTRFVKSVINSCAQLSYDHAQMMLDNPTGDDLEEDSFPEILHGQTVRSLAVIVNQLQSIAVRLRQRRMDDGCLKINQPKLTFRLDPATGRPIEYGVYKLRASNEMIEDFMLLANTSVAQAIQAARPSSSVLRNHKPPADNMMKNLVRTLVSHGHTFSFASSKDIRESMEAIVTGAKHPDAACSVLNVLLAKPMTRALYYCSAFASEPQQFKHYALAIPMYTHFTSPIRRYADCLVHRVLAAMLGVDDEPKRTPDELQKLATICNEKKYNAKLAGDASSMLYYRHWLRSVKQHETVGAVLAYGSHYIELVLIHSGIVLKASTKKISAVASVVFKEVEPVGSLQLIPNDRSIDPVTLKIFSKVRVTIKLVHDAISVCSILPMVEKSPIPEATDSNAESADNMVNLEKKSSHVY